MPIAEPAGISEYLTCPFLEWSTLSHEDLQAASETWNKSRVTPVI